MSSEVFNLAILLSLKDGASGGLDRFEARMGSAAQKINKDLQSIERNAKQQTQAIAKEIGKKTSEIEKFGGKLSNIDKLKSAGLQSAVAQSATIFNQLKKESDAVESLGNQYKKAGKTDAASQAAALSQSLRTEAKGIEQIGTKLKTIQKLREQGTESAKQQAQVLENEVKDELKNLDRLASKLREVKHLKTDNLEIKVKADDLRKQLSNIEAFEERYEQLRRDLNRDLSIGAVGLGGLALIGKGVQVAADYQSSMTDLRSSLSQVGADGKVNFDALGKDMLKAEAIAMKLGNSLPGTTQDFISAIQVLKQNGLQTETILNGAAEAVGNLAVANNALPKDVAKDFAQFGQLFNLKPDEYLKAADVFSRLYTSSGIATDELIQASKYFQGRSGAAMGLTGLKDAEESIRLISLLRKQGLEGTEAGTALNNLFSGYTSHDKAVEALKKDTGIAIEFFDKKGDFAGIDNLFKQLEPLQKLSEEDRTIRLKAIFGEEGMSAATAILKTGVDGWKQYNEAQNKTISLHQKNAEKAKDFNNQMEALAGSAKNLVVTSFEPMLPSLTSGINSLNGMVGSLQEFGKANPALVENLGTLALYGSTAMVAYAGIKTLTTGVRLLSITSQFSKGSGILPYLSGVKEEAGKATSKVAGFARPLDAANQKAGKFKGTIQSLANSSALKIGVQIVGIAAAEMALTHLISMWSEAAEKSNQFYENAKGVRMEYDALVGQSKLYGAPGDYGNTSGSKNDLDVVAGKFIEAIKRGRDLETSLAPERKTWWEHATNPTPYGMAPNQSQFGGSQFSPDVAAKMWRDAAITMPVQDPNVLARVLVQLQKSDMNLNLDQIALLTQALEKVAGKADMDTARGIAQKELYGDKPQSNFRQQPFGAPFSPLQNPSLYKPVQSPLQQPPAKFETGMIASSIFSKINPTVQGLFDLNKPLSGITQNFQDLQQPLSGLPVPIRQFELGMLGLPQQLDTTSQSITQFWQTVDSTQEPLNRLNSSVGSVAVSAGSVANSLNNVSVQLANWKPPVPQIQTYMVGVPQGAGGAPVVGVRPPSKASGGTVLSDGLVYVHAGEDIMPANVTRQYRQPPAVNKNKEAASGFVQTLSSFKTTQSASNHTNSVNSFSSIDRSAERARGQFMPAGNPDNFASKFEFSPEKSASPSVVIPNSAIGGIDTTERRSQPELRNFQASAAAPNITLHAPITVTIHEATQNVQTEIQQQLNEHVEHLERLLVRISQNGRARG